MGLDDHYNYRSGRLDQNFPNNIMSTYGGFRMSKTCTVVRNAFLILASISIATMSVVADLGLQYDDSGLKGVAFWYSQIAGFPYWAISELVGSLGLRLSRATSIASNGILLLVISSALDWLLWRFFWKKLLRSN